MPLTAARHGLTWLGGQVVDGGVRLLQSAGLTAASLSMALLPGEDGHRVTVVAVARRVAAMGFGALPLTVLFGTTIGLVLGAQLEVIVPQVGLLDYWIRTTTELLSQQVAPVLGAILLASRSGAALAADLSTMTAAGEVDALRGMGLSPVRLLIAPAIWGALATTPVLVALMIAAAAATLAIYLNIELAIPALWVIAAVMDALTPSVVATALAKGAAFGVLVTALAASQGLVRHKVPRAVGRNVTSALVSGVGAMLVANALWTALL